jgi:hypothetical protein
MTLSALLLVAALTHDPDPVALTRVTVVVDTSTWADVKASLFLPVGFGTGYGSGPSEVRLCDRLSCLVMVPSDSAAGRVIGDVEVGVQPVTGSVLASRLEQLGPHAGVAIVPPPLFEAGGSVDELPLMYYIEIATIAVSDSTLARIEPLLRSAGADVLPEGEGLVVRFPNQTIRLVPDYAGAGVRTLTWRLRREADGNPTYRFGGRSRLRFGPGRTATWTF